MKLCELINPPYFANFTSEYLKQLAAITSNFTKLTDTGRVFAEDFSLMKFEMTNNGHLAINDDPARTPTSPLDVYIVMKDGIAKAFSYVLRLNEWNLIHTIVIFAKNSTNTNSSVGTIPSGLGVWLCKQIKDFHPKKAVMFDTLASANGRKLIFGALKNSGGFVANVFTGEFISRDEEDLLKKQENTVMIK
jgi:hypothetical protein